MVVTPRRNIIVVASRQTGTPHLGDGVDFFWVASTPGRIRPARSVPRAPRNSRCDSLLTVGWACGDARRAALHRPIDRAAVSPGPDLLPTALRPRGRDPTMLGMGPDVLRRDHVASYRGRNLRSNRRGAGRAEPHGAGDRSDCHNRNSQTGQGSPLSQSTAIRGRAARA